MTLNSKKNKSKGIKTLAILAGSCLMSTVLIQTPASAIIGRLASSATKIIKPVTNGTLLRSTPTKTELTFARKQFHPTTNRIDLLKQNLVRNSTSFASSKVNISPGTQKVTQLASRFGNVSGNNSGFSGTLRATLTNID